ncbi:hypothetical protein IGB42_01888 [Andreprevotia sp. IGB-42]|uniref:hypothetical protein n=1 Tax=Andreprevotia sp. IGB-42 TaxID=2497473 RepID=UPI00135B8BDF|nr:hypothetical protein [Andreprevotia sp. IGB-42]KAF0813537.1 hypothetical protein IGB42_01888 [Andreprevotia sp. IGB-42]
MSYADTLNQTKNGYPFDKWTDAFEAGMEQYSEENVAAARDVLDELIEQLITLGPDAEEAEKVALFQSAVEVLNDLDDSISGLIETGEREDLCALFDNIAEAAGLDPDQYGDGDGIASEWREW